MVDDVVADAHFEHIWKAYEDFLKGRGILSERIRQLAVIGQCSTMGEEVELCFEDRGDQRLPQFRRMRGEP